MSDAAPELKSMFVYFLNAIKSNFPYPSKEKGLMTSFAVSEMMQDYIKETKNQINVTCKAGCSYCCHTVFKVTESEAKVLADSVKSNSLPIDREKLKMQSRALKSVTDKNWNNLSYEEKRCVFLDENNMCSAYHIKPYVCSTYIVDTPKENCHEASKKQTRVITAIKPGALVLAAQQNEKIGPLPVMLEKELKS